MISLMPLITTTLYCITAVLIALLTLEYFKSIRTNASIGSKYRDLQKKVGILEETIRTKQREVKDFESLLKTQIEAATYYAKQVNITVENSTRQLKTISDLLSAYILHGDKADLIEAGDYITQLLDE